MTTPELKWTAVRNPSRYGHNWPSMSHLFIGDSPRSVCGNLIRAGKQERPDEKVRCARCERWARRKGEAA